MSLVLDKATPSWPAMNMSLQSTSTLGTKEVKYPFQKYPHQEEQQKGEMKRNGGPANTLLHR